MTPRERMFAAVRGRPTDRMPVATYNCHGFSFGRHGSCAEYGPILEAVERTGAGVLCKVQAERSGGLPPAEATETTRGGERITTWVLHTPGGALRSVTRKPPGQPARRVEPYVKSDEDIQRVLSLTPTDVRWDLEGLEPWNNCIVVVVVHRPEAEYFVVTSYQDYIQER